MKRFLLPSFCAVLLAGCAAAEQKAAVADKAEPPAAAAAVPAPAPALTTNTVVIPPPKPPPELPAPVQEVVRLAQTTLSEGVLVDYIATIQEPFALTADHIIYLNDLGVPMAAIQALLKRQTPELAGTAAGAPVEAGKGNVLLTNYLASTAPPIAPAALAAAPAAAGQPVATEAPIVAPQPVTQVTYNTFYDSLSPYGSWVDVPGSGWCWRPSVAVVNANWQPYSDNGSWVWSDCGWYWRSSYSWGWAPFHYGRWHRAAGFGWCWTPGYNWGPAWVTWRSSGAHCGWAPLPPSCGWSVGIGLTWHGRRAAADCDFGLGFDHFVYLGWNRFCDPAPWRHRVARAEVASVHSQTRPINDIRGNGNTGVNIVGNNNTVVINHGPGLDPVQKHTRGEIAKARLVDTSDATRVTAARGAGSTAVLPVYRPSINAPTAGARPAPSSALLARQETGVNNAIVGGPSVISRRPVTTASPARGEAPVARSGSGASRPAASPAIVPPARSAVSSPARPAVGAAAPDSTPSSGGPVIIGRNPGSPAVARPASPQPVNTARPNVTTAPSRPTTYPGGSQPQQVRPITSIPDDNAPRYSTTPNLPRTQVSRGEAPKPNFNPAPRSVPAPSVPQVSQPAPAARPAPSYDTRPAPNFRSEVARPAPVQRSEPARNFQAPPAAAEPRQNYAPPAQSYRAPERSYSAPAPAAPAQRSSPPPSNSGGGGGGSRPAPSNGDRARPN